MSRRRRATVYRCRSADGGGRHSVVVTSCRGVAARHWGGGVAASSRYRRVFAVSERFNVVNGGRRGIAASCRGVQARTAVEAIVKRL